MQYTYDITKLLDQTARFSTGTPRPEMIRFYRPNFSGIEAWFKALRESISLHTVIINPAFAPDEAIFLRYMFTSLKLFAWLQHYETYQLAGIDLFGFSPSKVKIFAEMHLPEIVISVFREFCRPYILPNGVWLYPHPYSFRSEPEPDENAQTRNTVKIGTFVPNLDRFRLFIYPSVAMSLRGFFTGLNLTVMAKEQLDPQRLSVTLIHYDAKHRLRKEDLPKVDKTSLRAMEEYFNYQNQFMKDHAEDEKFNHFFFPAGEEVKRIRLQNMLRPIVLPVFDDYVRLPPAWNDRDPVAFAFLGEDPLRNYSLAYDANRFVQEILNYLTLAEASDSRIYHLNSWRAHLVTYPSLADWQLQVGPKPSKPANPEFKTAEGAEAERSSAQRKKGKKS